MRTEDIDRAVLGGLWHCVITGLAAGLVCSLALGAVVLLLAAPG